MSFARVLAWRDKTVIHFTVHEQPDPPADRLDRAEALVFVRDGFSYAAAAFAPVWLIAKRQWLALLVYLAVLAAVMLGLAAVDAPPQWFMVASSALHLLVGFEADAIERWALDRGGYSMIGSVSGRTQTDCERRFLETWLPQQPVLSGSVSSASTRGTLASAADGLIGGAASGGRGWLSALRRS